MGVKKDIADKLVFLSTGAFGFIAALAWNDAVKSLFDEGGILHLVAGKGVWIYALTITILGVFVTIWISKLASKVR